MVARTLLLGAGFSRNFGLPLAKDILVEMFNRLTSPILKKEVLQEIERGNNDFESYYSVKVTGNIANADSKEVRDTLLEIYKSMDECILRSFGNERFSYLKVIRFINKFSAREGGSGYVFTLNQDLLLERLFSTYLQKKNFYCPGGWDKEYQGDLLPYYGPVDSPFYKYHKSDTRDQKLMVAADDITGEIINQWNEKYRTSYEEIKRRVPCLVKLHGTYYWTINKGSEQLWGIGKNKLEQIKSEPLLYLQYKIFEEILTERNLFVGLIYIIGYSFCDDHINEIIHKACKKGSKLIIIDVLSLKDFLNIVDLSFKRIGAIFDRKWLHQYLSSSFEMFFPFCDQTPILFNGNREESIIKIDNLPCTL